MAGARAAHVEYCRALNNASMLGQRDLWRLRQALDIKDKQAVKDALLMYYPAFVDKYGDMAATAAAARFEAARSAAKGGAAEVQIASRVDLGKLEAQVRFALCHLYDNDIGPEYNPEDVFQYLAGRLDKEVKGMARDTIVANVDAERDARFVRVPDVNACSWCVEIAGNGTLYSTAEAAGEGNEYHPHCNCQVEPVFVVDGDEDAASDEARELVEAGEDVDMPTTFADYNAAEE